MRLANKYGAQRTWSETCQRTFDSKAEARRATELALLERAGEITDLQYQVRFVLSEQPRKTITIDFSYRENGERVLEDYKGVMTRDFATKLAWLKQRYGLDVRITR